MGIFWPTNSFYFKQGVEDLQDYGVEVGIHTGDFWGGPSSGTEVL